MFPHVVHIKLETLLGFSVDGQFGPWRGGGDRAEQARVEWLTSLQRKFDLPIKREQFPYTAARSNAKTGKPFNGVAYAAGLYYARALRHDKAACRELFSEADAAFISSQLDDEAESALGYAKLAC